MNDTSSQSTASSTDDTSKSENDTSGSNKASNSASSNQTVSDENKIPSVQDEPPVIPSSMYGRNNYVMPYSDYSYLTSRQLAQVSNYELGIARNEIYARHGYIFQLDQFRRYFESQNWYVPRYTDQSDIALNKYEKYNAEAIKTEEDSRGVKRKWQKSNYKCYKLCFKMKLKT